jgi:hypothetical protein
MNETENLDHTPSYSGNKVIAIMRIFLWLMPAIFIPAAFLLMIFLDSTTRIRGGEFLLVITFTLAFVATACVGYFDQRLALMQKKIPPPHSKKELARWTIIFVLAQIIIAPTLCWSVLYGYCVVTANM